MYKATYNAVLCSWTLHRVLIRTWVIWAGVSSPLQGHTQRVTVAPGPPSIHGQREPEQVLPKS